MENIARHLPLSLRSESVTGGSVGQSTGSSVILDIVFKIIRLAAGRDWCGRIVGGAIFFWTLPTEGLAFVTGDLGKDFVMAGLVTFLTSRINFTGSGSLFGDNTFISGFEVLIEGAIVTCGAVSLLDAVSKQLGSSNAKRFIEGTAFQFKLLESWVL